MEATIIDDIAFDIQARDLYSVLKISAGARHRERIDSLLTAARDVAKPRFAYVAAAVEHHDHSTVFLNGMPLKSRVVRVNLNDCRRAFPFIATCGAEMEDWSRKLKGTLDTFCTDMLNMLALGTAVDTFKKHIQNRFETGIISTMNPGSLEDWPLSDQEKIFSLLGGAASLIGVRLTKGMMMVPLKSVSGLAYESGKKFYNCQFCPRENCLGRRASYDPHLYATKYRGTIKKQ